MRAVGPLVIAALVALVGCAADGPPCPCGGSFDDPFGNAPTEASSPYDHSADDHCICRCAGVGPERYLSLFEDDCRKFETECEVNGYESTYECI